MKLELEISDEVANKFKNSYQKDLLGGDTSRYMKNIEELIHEILRVAIQSDFIFMNGGGLLQMNYKSN